MAPVQALPVRKSASETAAPCLPSIHPLSYPTLWPETERAGHILTVLVQYPAQRHFSPQPKRQNK